jgi:L-aminopeptidase/D-esterase-like protein
VDPAAGGIVAGARPVKLGPLRVGRRGRFADTLQVMRSPAGRAVLSLAGRGSTVIAVVATDAKLDKAGAAKVAQMAQDGIARAVRPAHTMLDGDTVFALATGQKRADVSTVGAFAAEALAEAILRAVRAAEPAAGLPSARDG